MNMRIGATDASLQRHAADMAGHKSFTIATNVQVYFYDPRSPWQRGSNENTNGLLRQYFPRGTDLSHFSQAHLNKIALRLNQRPRKTLGFERPPINYEPSRKLPAPLGSVTEAPLLLAPPCRRKGCWNPCEGGALIRLDLS